MRILLLRVLGFSFMHSRVRWKTRAVSGVEGFAISKEIALSWVRSTGSGRKGFRTNELFLFHSGHRRTPVYGIGTKTYGKVER